MSHFDTRQINNFFCRTSDDRFTKFAIVSPIAVAGSGAHFGYETVLKELSHFSRSNLVKSP